MNTRCFVSVLYLLADYFPWPVCHAWEIYRSHINSFRSIMLEMVVCSDNQTIEFPDYPVVFFHTTSIFDGVELLYFLPMTEDANNQPPHNFHPYTQEAWSLPLSYVHLDLETFPVVYFFVLSFLSPVELYRDLQNEKSSNFLPTEVRGHKNFTLQCQSHQYCRSVWTVAPILEKWVCIFSIWHAEYVIWSVR